ncbi:uncharacterized protein [Temnothorax nylanderi]|uniref:uncharacterized protein n=1 Tax=Temnothorax nylanderi TaxID=102681 RepID=UPI003A86FAE4
MSSKENVKPTSKNKHYTTMERKVFLQILERYKHIVELKKSDGATLKDKDVAWIEICTAYNQSSLIAQKRTVQQLKKLWTNLKQGQREALTKKKQACMATGGGPPEVKIDIDPDIARIAPHLMKTAPVAFTFNMSDIEINDKRDYVFEVISTDQTVELLDTDNEDYKNTHSKHIFQDPCISTEKDDTLMTLCSGEEQEKDVRKEELSNKLENEKLKHTRSFKRKKDTISYSQLSNTEETIRMKRIKRVMAQEKRLAHIKQKHEENMNNMKENYLKEIQNLELQHLRRIQTLEIEIKETQLRSGKK